MSTVSEQSARQQRKRKYGCDSRAGGEKDAHVQKDFLLAEAEEPATSLNMSFSLLCKMSLVPLVHVCVRAASVFETQTMALRQHHPESPNKAYRLIMVLFHKGSKFTLGGWNSDS